MLEQKESIERKARVKRLKKMIGIFWLALVVLPTFLCLFLFVKINQIEKQINQIITTSALEVEQQVKQESLAAKKQEEAVIKIEEAKSEKTAEFDTSKEEVEKLHRVYLTFDDGPSIYTDEILDILKEYDVKATFFVVGKEESQYKRIYRRIVEEGHSIGVHSYSHKYWEIYQSKESFTEDLSKIQSFVYDITGVRSNILRFPGGSSNNASKVDIQELIGVVEELGMTYYDWNIASGDATQSNVPAQTILQNCIDPMDTQNSSVILLHDAGDKRSTVEALPMIIEKTLERENTVILPITEETKPIQHITKK